MKKKYLLLIGCLGLCLFAGCSGKPSESSTSNSQNSDSPSTSNTQDSDSDTSSDSSDSDSGSSSDQSQNAHDDLEGQGKTLREQAEECVGKEVSQLTAAIGEPNSISSEEDPELGTIDYYYYDDFTVSIAADEDGNQKVTGIW